MFKRTPMTDMIKLTPTAPAYSRWRYIKTVVGVPQGVSSSETIAFDYTVSTSFKMTQKLDVEYLGTKAGLSYEFSASFTQSFKYSKTESITGPVPTRVFYTQDVVIPTARGNVILPTSHVVYVFDNEDPNTTK